ncbi:Serum Response Factor-Binding Protein 1 [Manis pentadactyla]|nr:Serum Response Factor-Binding Protein 1 [Manis pentadactyla]
MRVSARWEDEKRSEENREFLTENLSGVGTEDALLKSQRRARRLLEEIPAMKERPGGAVALRRPAGMEPSAKGMDSSSWGTAHWAWMQVRTQVQPYKENSGDYQVPKRQSHYCIFNIEKLETT